MFNTVTKKIFALVSASLLLIAPAYAQSVILTIDQAYVLANSEAGKSISTQLKSLQTSAESDLQKQVDTLKSDYEKLSKQKTLLSENDFQKKAVELEKRRQELPSLQEIKKRELAISEQKALKAVADVMNPIIDNISKSRKATIVVDKSVLIYSNDSVDITDEVLKQVNRKLKKVNVEKTDLIAAYNKAVEDAKKSSQ